MGEWIHRCRQTTTHTFGLPGNGHTDVICSVSIRHILAVRKSTLLPIDTIIRHQVSDIS
ncbi:hypothetical protein GQK85_23350 [Escherichia coli]|nr:hypothetical protein [Escherichia coli]EFH7437198.1 hypothetical protein [Escherichia coli]EFH7479250.1 hypothetical protein [Escherichia coli]